ncbi:hypothetical protein CLAIMM_06590 [Cladophialophora immunda]|nr:hypothetical protein CLAIMM_06590 [Cladophialophora immunda]
MATATDVELRTVLSTKQQSSVVARDRGDAPTSSIPIAVERRLDAEEAPTNAATAIPEGGYGWTIVSVCALLTFWFNGISGSWGVVQAALLQSKLTDTPTSTISFVGTLGLACVVAFGLFGVRLVRLLGARATALLGVALVSLGEICSSFTTANVGGLFGCSGVLFGLGACLCYSISNTLPTQYFAARLGLASGLVKFGGGIGAAERVPLGRVPFLDLSLFRNLPFTAIFCAGAIGTFALFVPPFFLPLVAQSVGLSSSTGAGLVGAFNACTAVGRFVSGWLSDLIGPVNMFLLAMTLNAVSMLAIWPVSDSLAPLVVFAMLNGLANGAFFTLYPVVVASTAARVDNSESGRVAIAMGMAISGWTGGYLMGVPIAGYLLQASGVGGGSSSSPSGAGRQGKSGASIDPYRPAIFYAGGVALAAAGCVLIARLKLARGMRKRV